MLTATIASGHNNCRSTRHRVLAVLLTAVSCLAGCTGVPDGVQPVEDFELERYLGRWYEIARLDHSFERGLTRVSAEYSPGEDGSVIVLNRGYSAEDGWQSAEGKALFMGPADQGYLKVSFFGPFYGSYIVFELDPDYQYAFISGNSKSYLWLLARTPTVSPELRAHFVQRAAELGFPVEQLIFVDQGEDGAR
jgi:apolipoprotein D and lipocalin family protein